jgi:hypothetical protein
MTATEVVTKRVALELPDAPALLPVGVITAFLDAVDLFYAAAVVAVMPGYERMPTAELDRLDSSRLSPADRLTVEQLNYGSPWQTVFAEVASHSPLELLALIPLLPGRLADAIRAVALIRSQIRMHDAIADAIRAGRLIPAPPPPDVRDLASKITELLTPALDPLQASEDVTESRRAVSCDAADEADRALQAHPGRVASPSELGTEPNLPAAVRALLEDAGRRLSESMELLGPARVVDPDTGGPVV